MLESIPEILVKGTIFIATAVLVSAFFYGPDNFLNKKNKAILLNYLPDHKAYIEQLIPDEIIKYATLIAWLRWPTIVTFVTFNAASLINIVLIWLKLISLDDYITISFALIAIGYGLAIPYAILALLISILYLQNIETVRKLTYSIERRKIEQSAYDHEINLHSFTLGKRTILFNNIIGGLCLVCILCLTFYLVTNYVEIFDVIHDGLVVFESLFKKLSRLFT